MEFQILVVLHVILAILLIGPAWIGALFIMPWAIRTNDSSVVSSYFRPFYKVSHALLAFQFIVGFRLAMLYLPMEEWFTFSSSLSLSVVLKLLLWILFFGWMIAGKRKGFTEPDRVNLASAKQFFIILSILGLALLVSGLNFRLGLF